MPLDPKLQKFTTSAPAIASYNFEDIVSGTGIIVLYAGTTVDKNILSNFVFTSNRVAEATEAMPVDGGYVKEFDMDFDVTINKTVELSGTALVTIPIKCTNAVSVGNSADGYAVAILKKEDVAIVTNTGVANGVVTSTATDQGWGANIAYGNPTIDLVIPDGTIFKRGDTLRLTVEIWGRATQGTGTITFAHDPADRTQDWRGSSAWDSTGASMSSQIKLQIPTVIDL